MRQIIFFGAFIFTAIFLFSTCKNAAETEVRYAGALRQMMMGDLQAKASLDTLKQKQHLWAIGAVAHLKGEVQIFDGQPLNTSLSAGEITLDRTFDKKTTLLVYSQVSEWQNIQLRDRIENMGRIEAFIEKNAKETDLDTEAPFPFLIEGKVKSLDWHIIDWKAGDTVHSPDKHREAGAKGSLENEEVAIIGFYSKYHRAVFTHHSTNVHMHFKTREEKLAGHVDDLQFDGNAILKLPKH